MVFRLEPMGLTVDSGSWEMRMAGETCCNGLIDRPSERIIDQIGRVDFGSGKSSLMHLWSDVTLENVKKNTQDRPVRYVTLPPSY